MQPDSLDYFNFSEINADDPLFAVRLFSAVCKQRKQHQARDGDNIKRVCAEEYDEISKRVDATGIQESCSVRNVLRTRRLANLLVNDKGELNISLIPRMLTQLQAHCFSLGPNRQHDSVRQTHLIACLTKLKDNKELQQLIKQVTRPHAHPLAEQIIRDALQISGSVPVTDAHARRAVLSSWFCYLRQNVGSCFATAPAIIIHDEQAEQFLIDLKELINTGRIKRTYGGHEYSVPLSPSWGAGDLRKPIVLDLYAPDYKMIWHAPGLIAAMEAAELFAQDAASKEKAQLIETLVKGVFPEWNINHPYVLTSVEQIMRRMLMHNLSLSQEEIDAYENRPKEMIYSSLLIQSAASGAKMGGKGDACAQFFHLLELGGSAFRGLSENALLKAWEFTIASFSEIKSEFTRWNLYSSLGLRPEEPQGIGQALYEIIVQALDVMNRKVNDLQIEYEQMYMILKQLEVRMRSGDKENQWIRADYQSKLHEFELLEELRNREHTKAQLFANLYNLLIEQYDKLFPRYFQEVYDADLHEVQTGPFDDSPAGFRLLYKHGRASTALWTKIKTPAEFSEALANFFISTENEIASQDQFQPIQRELTEIITALVTHVKTNEFLESAFYRMAKAHKVNLVADPLENLEKVPVKPWAYVSGGTMETLISSYYRREAKPTEVARWVENPMELLVFLVDTLKHMPYSTTESYLKTDRSILMYSPTHAFLLKPGNPHFSEAWQSEEYTYTWVRDRFVRPMENFIDLIRLETSMIAYLVERLQEHVPENYRHYFTRVFNNLYGPMSTYDFREHLLERIDREHGLHSMGRAVLNADQIDALLYQLLPLFPSYELEQRLQKIIESLELSKDVREKCDTLIEKVAENVSKNHLMNAEQLQEICLMIVAAASEKTSLPFDLAALILKAARQLGYAIPAPIIFADTNWVKDYFAFLVNPGTGTLQLWRVDALGKAGMPMSVWQEWLNGSRKDRMWGVLIKPEEYTPAFTNVNLRQPGLFVR